jgi:hypothetical protein
MDRENIDGNELHRKKARRELSTLTERRLGDKKLKYQRED